jgi:hypothetical protein
MPRAKRPVVDISDEQEARIQEGIAKNPDNPELTDEQLRPAARSFRLRSMPP